MTRAVAPATGRGPAPARRIPGETGVWVFVLGDMAVFAVCFAILTVIRGRDPEAYVTSVSRLHLGIGVVNTLVLLTTSLTLALAVRAARDGHTGPGTAAPRLVAATVAGAALFAALKITEYVLLVSAGDTPRTDDVLAAYFAFTGLHLLHVAIGLAVLGGVLRVVWRRALGVRDRMMVENGAAYWHMVDLLWLVLFALLYLTG